MLYSTYFCSKYLQITEKAVPLHCVFHSIRFKVNKGWSKALLLFYIHTFGVMIFSTSLLYSRNLQNIKKHVKKHIFHPKIFADN